MPKEKSFKSYLESYSHLIVPLSIIIIFLFFLSDLLFSAKRMVSHDTLWFYGVFHYFAKSLQNGIFPYWNPFNYCGQPFYTDIAIMDLVNPLTIAIIALGKLFKGSLFTLYHWNFIIRIIATALGVFLFSREVTKNKFSAYLVLFVFIFSSFTFSSLRQEGIAYSLSWLPWALIFLLRFLKQRNLLNTLGFSLFFGLCLTGYNGIFAVVYLGIFLLALLINKKVDLKSLFRKKSLKFVILSTVIIILLASQLIHFFLIKDKFLPMARMKTSPGQQGAFSDSKGGVYSQPADFLGLINQKIAAKGYFEKNYSLSEGFLYIGIIPLILALIGLLFAKDKFKISFIFSTLVIILLMLGPRVGLFKFLNYIFPPFKFIRHTQLFSGFFIFNLMYFLGQGADYIFNKLNSRNFKISLISIVFILTAFDLFAYANQALDYVTLPRPAFNFNEHSEKSWDSVLERKQRLVTSDKIRYYRSLLYAEATAFNSATTTEYFTGDFLNSGLYELYSLAQNRKLSFSGASLNHKVSDFINSGFLNYHNFNPVQKGRFLDILNILVFDLSRNMSFYNCFRGSEKILLAMRSLVFLGNKNLKENTSWGNIDDAKKLFTIFLNLKLKALPKGEKAKFNLLGKDLNFNEAVALHQELYNKISFKDYLTYLWATNHSEEFTLLQLKNYHDFLQVYKQAESFKVKKLLRQILGLDYSIIQFAPNANFFPRGKILEVLKETAGDGELFIESEKEQAQEGASLVELNTKILKYEPNTLSLELNNPQAGYLFFSKGYDGYWQASVNGKASKVLQANLAFTAIQIPAGNKRIDFVYNPWPYKITLFLYYITIIAVIFACSFILSRKNK